MKKNRSEGIMKGKIKKNIVLAFILCLLCVLIFMREVPKEKRGIGVESLITKDEPIGYIEDKEYIVNRIQRSKSNNNITDLKIEDTKSIEKSSDSIKVEVEESRDIVPVSNNDENGMRHYNTNYYNTNKLTDNYYEGYVEYNSPDGWSYQGEWVHDVIEGKGSLQYANGDSYTGIFVNGEKSGEGTYYFSDGSVYEGTWEHDMWNGVGTFTSIHGFSYKGDFKEGLKHGSGTFLFSNGDSYNGEFANDKENGEGTWISTQGWTYVGSFRNGQRNGGGKMTYANGDYYNGEWVNNIKEGIGYETYRDENNNKIGFYEGNFKNNCRYGKGIFTYSNGIIMKGEWINDEYVGGE